MVLPLEPLNDAGVIPRRALVHDTHVAHARPVAEQLRAPVADGGFCDRHVVDVSVEQIEVGCALDGVVGVHDPDVVTAALGQGQRLGAVMAEVAPWPFEKLARDPEFGHVIADQVLGSVVGAGVHDHPRADVRRGRIERLLNDVRLVAHDHVQADRGTRGHRLGHGQIIFGIHAAVARLGSGCGDAKHLVEAGGL